MKSEAEEKILGNGRRPRVNLDFKGLVRYKGYIYIKHIKRSSLDPEKDSISTSYRTPMMIHEQTRSIISQ